jgi:hypothetical protein
MQRPEMRKYALCVRMVMDEQERRERAEAEPQRS